MPVAQGVVAVAPGDGLVATRVCKEAAEGSFHGRARMTSGTGGVRRMASLAAAVTLGGAATATVLGAVTLGPAVPAGATTTHRLRGQRKLGRGRHHRHRPSVDRHRRSGAASGSQTPAADVSGSSTGLRGLNGGHDHEHHDVHGRGLGSVPVSHRHWSTGPAGAQPAPNQCSRQGNR